MLERYTEKARRVIFFARYEASQYGSPYIEHLLLGILRQNDGCGRARLLTESGLTLDPHGALWVGFAQIQEDAKLIFTAPGWAKSTGKIEDVQFVGGKAVMATLVSEAAAQPEKPNPGCVRRTVILAQNWEGWSVAGSSHQSPAPLPRSRCLTLSCSRRY